MTLPFELQVQKQNQALLINKCSPEQLAQISNMLSEYINVMFDILKPTSMESLLNFEICKRKMLKLQVEEKRAHTLFLLDMYYLYTLQIKEHFKKQIGEI
jgi:hypothetical protein